MECQTPVTSEPLALNPLKNMVQVDEIDYSADFLIYIREWTISTRFLKKEKYLIPC